MKNIYILDGNDDLINVLRLNGKNAIIYKAPNKIPFDDSSVDYIHCSHFIEHLYPEDLYQFFKEIDRILRKNGIFVISTPLLWNSFYNDLSHIKPYNPKVILKYFCLKNMNPTYKDISKDYSKLICIYRYHAYMDIDEGWGSNRRLINFFLRIYKFSLRYLGIKRYVKNGFTLVLRKN